MEHIIKGLQLEIVGSTIENIEHDLFEKYKMVGNLSARKYTRNVAIYTTSTFESSDDFIYECNVDRTFGSKCSFFLKNHSLTRDLSESTLRTLDEIQRDSIHYFRVFFSSSTIFLSHQSDSLNQILPLTWKRKS